MTRLLLDHRRSALIGVFAFVFLVAATAPAVAAMASTPVMIDAAGGLHVMDAVGQKVTIDLDRYTALGRWSTAVGKFHQASGMDMMQMVFGAGRLSGQGWAMDVFTQLWIALRWMMMFAIGFTFVNEAGLALDKAAAALVDLVTKGPLGGVVMVVLLFTALAAAHRRQPGAWRRVIAAAVVIAALFVMGGAATQSTEVKAADGTSVFKPATGSPGWLIVTLNGSVTSVAGGVASAIPLGDSEAQTVQNVDAKASPTLNCRDVMAGIHRFEQTWVSGGMASRSTEAAMGILVSRMWENIGLETYKAVQYGAGNPYADEVFCRGLEMNAGFSYGQQYELMNVGAADLVKKGVAGAVVPALTPRDYRIESNVYTHNNDANWQATMVAWAACSTNDGGATWTVRPEWATEYVKEGAKITDGDCTTWGLAADLRKTDIPDARNIPDIFDIPTGPDGVNKVVPMTGEGSNTDNANAIRDYLNSLTAGSGSMFGAGITNLGYALSSLANSLVLGGVAIGAIFAKVFASVLALMLIIVMVTAIFFRDVGRRIGTAFLQLLGATVFSALALLTMSLVVFLTRLLMQIGAAVTDPGSIGALIWASASPVMAWIALWAVATKLLRLPNPMSLKGGMLWAGAMGAGAGALAGQFSGGRAGGGALSRAEAAAQHRVDSAKRASTDFMLGRDRKGGPSRIGARQGALGSATGGQSEHVDEMMSAEEQALARQAGGSSGILGGAVERMRALAFSRRGGDAGEVAGGDAPKHGRRAKLGAGLVAGLVGGAAAAPDRIAAGVRAAGKRETWNALGSSIKRGSVDAARTARYLASRPAREHALTTMRDAGKLAMARQGGRLAALPGAVASLRKSTSYQYRDSATGALKTAEGSGVNVLRKAREVQTRKLEALAQRRGLDMNNLTADGIRDARRADRREAIVNGAKATGRAAKGAYALSRTKGGKAVLGTAAAAVAVGATGGLAAVPLAMIASNRAAKSIRKLGSASNEQVMAYRKDAADKLAAKRDEQRISAQLDREERVEAARAERAAARGAATSGGAGDAGDASPRQNVGNGGAPAGGPDTRK